MSVAVSKRAFLLGAYLGKDYKVENAKLFSMVVVLFYIPTGSMRKSPCSISLEHTSL